MADQQVTAVLRIEYRTVLRAGVEPLFIVHAAMIIRQLAQREHRRGSHVYTCARQGRLVFPLGSLGSGVYLKHQRDRQQKPNDLYNANHTLFTNTDVLISTAGYRNVSHL